LSVGVQATPDRGERPAPASPEPCRPGAGDGSPTRFRLRDSSPERDIPFRPAGRGPPMSTAIAPVEVPAAADPRMAAFLAPNCPEVFHSVATPTAIWQANPYDVETIHAEAREAFDRLLYRGGRTPPPPSGAVLVLLGEAGSGKTHLMRAFRTRAHRQGLG